MLRPFFCFYGGKWRAAKRYPEPRYRQIVEPFAGAAGYSTRYADRDVLLLDTDEFIVGIWQYLIEVNETEFLKLPVEVDCVDDLPIPQEARWLIAMWLNKGSAVPKKRASTWAKSGLRPNSYWGVAVRALIASQLRHIRHWQIRLADYSSAENGKATWFIDPPYEGRPGKFYRKRLTDYPKLARFCQTRLGQVIVCERSGAGWLPFKGLGTIKGTPGKRRTGYSKEAVWLND